MPFPEYLTRTTEYKVKTLRGFRIRIQVGNKITRLVYLQQRFNID